MELDVVKGKYQEVIDLAKAKNCRVNNVHIEGEKLLIRADAPNAEVKDALWNCAKGIDPVFADLWLDLSIDGSLPAPAPDVKSYTVVAGDSLWKIAANHLGNGALFPEIIKANPGKLKDQNSVIHPGDVLVIPNL
ncbi:MAG: LysM peptidoglycan-binding domain-containing protein [Acidobacteria bacterium]|nr:LysM peptidoglycan-binding domain-containing protein [Acidobacteriota bacterium]